MCIRDSHGVDRGCVRRVLQLRALHRVRGSAAMTIDLSGWSCPLPLRDEPNIMLGHGGGGKMSAELVEHLFLPAFDNAALRSLGDGAVVAEAAQGGVVE